MKKFINWNVNGLRAILSKGDLVKLIEDENPDIISLEEIKVQEDQLKHEFEGYHRYINSAERKGYSGTMVLSKEEALSVSYDIEGEDHPKEGRVITLEFADYYYVCAYVPNSKDGLLRLDYRQEWEEWLRFNLNELKKVKPVVYCGDLNVAHNEIDLKNPDTNHKNAGFSDEERAKFTQLLASGFVDTYRYLYPEKVEYSWWSYRMKARERNVGWRIDYFVVSEDLKEKIIDAKIHYNILGSDHCPVSLDIDL